MFVERLERVDREANGDKQKHEKKGGAEARFDLAHGVLVFDLVLAREDEIEFAAGARPGAVRGEDDE